MKMNLFFLFSIFSILSCSQKKFVPLLIESFPILDRNDIIYIGRDTGTFKIINFLVSNYSNSKNNILQIDSIACANSEFKGQCISKISIYFILKNGLMTEAIVKNHYEDIFEKAIKKQYLFTYEIIQNAGKQSSEYYKTYYSDGKSFESIGFKCN
ncbi:MAG: hypothetical protein ABIO44_01380 [Saprospiraceae bacterium]